jgi:hypothetical protein
MDTNIQAKLTWMGAKTPHGPPSLCTSPSDVSWSGLNLNSWKEHVSTIKCVEYKLTVPNLLTEICHAGNLTSMLLKQAELWYLNSAIVCHSKLKHQDILWHLHILRTCQLRKRERDTILSVLEPRPVTFCVVANCNCKAWRPKIHNDTEL